MKIDIQRLDRNGFKVMIDGQEADIHEIWIEPKDPTYPKAIGLLREEADLTDMQAEDILIKVREFQVWNALTR